jgi:hypothetical protein
MACSFSVVLSVHSPVHQTPEKATIPENEAEMTACLTAVELHFRHPCEPASGSS